MTTHLWRFFALGLLGAAILLAAPLPHHTTPSPADAQGDDAACNTLVLQAVREIGRDCAELGRNEACYGNTLVTATLSDPDLTFAESGDIVAVTNLAQLSTAAADPATNEWGIALLDLVADLPESGSDNLRLVVFGGVDVEPALPAADGFADTCTLTNNGTQNINLRVGPDTAFAAVDSLRVGQAVTGYGISTDGEWVRTSDGWLLASLTDNDCAGADLVTIDAASDGYRAPMQNFSLTIDSSGSCAAAPDGLLLQAPTGTTANIMINNVELRIGSTAFITIDNADSEMIIASFDGNVVATANGNSRRLRVGEETTVALSNNTASGNPTFPRPFTAPAQNVGPELISLLPEQFDIPAPALPRNASDTASTSSGPGQYLGCGSCNTCGFPENECITDPSGQCVWDPATCRDAFITERGQSFKGPFVIACQAGTSGTYTLIYTDRLGQNTLADGYATSLSGDATVNSWTTNEMFVDYDCPNGGASEDVTVTGFDTLGNVLIWVTTLNGQ